MRKLLSIILVSATTLAFAQPGKKGKGPSMAPELVPGYYVTAKGDTVKGDIQTNLENVGELYKTINFFPKGATKPTVVTTKKARAYGYGSNHFVASNITGQEEVYLKYLAKGRLNFMEFKYASGPGADAPIATDYFIQDSKADDANKDLRELKKLNEKFYKKELKPYMKDQPMIHDDLDKFTFNADKIANSIREYNRFYEGATE